jgi:hypothetical protein
MAVSSGERRLSGIGSQDGEMQRRTAPNPRATVRTSESSLYREDAMTAQTSLFHGNGQLQQLRRLIPRQHFECLERHLELLSREFPLFDHPPLSIDCAVAETLENLGIRAFQWQGSCNLPQRMALGSALMGEGFMAQSSTPEYTLYLNARGEKVLLRQEPAAGQTLVSLVSDCPPLFAYLAAKHRDAVPVA